MSVTTVPVSVSTGQPQARGVRLALIALTVAILLAVSLAIVAATTSTSHGTPTIAPAAPVHATAPQCRIGRPC